MVAVCTLNGPTFFTNFSKGWKTGNSAQSITDGSIFADENDVVVVSINYRLNIFGFPGVSGIPANLGLLDHRRALEWTRDNIEQFGGDPSRITLFGQSAGGVAVDLIAYAYPDDPIVHAIIPHSGVASSAVGIGDNQTAVLMNWYGASSNAGCGNETDAANSTLACMRTKTTQEILDAIAPIASSPLASGFDPVDDPRTHPTNISGKAADGNFAKLPYMAGNTINESGFFLILAIGTLTETQLDMLPYGAMQPLLDLQTMLVWTCPSADAVRYRAQQGVPAWRYLFYGGQNYTNPYIDRVGSNYHCSDLPIVFATAEVSTGIADEPYERQASAHMRRAWATFANDPANGLVQELGWPEYRKNGTSGGKSF